MEIRSTTDEDRDVFVDTVHAAFGLFPETPVDGGGLWWSALETDRCLLALTADGKPVGTASAYSFELTLPGGALVPVSGVTSVGVLPSHRRRGVLSAMMRRQLGDLKARGEFLSVLLASEAPIYGRYGYGPATHTGRLRVQRHRAALAAPRADDAGRPGRTSDTRGSGGGHRHDRDPAARRVRGDPGTGLRPLPAHPARRAVPAAPLVGAARGSAPDLTGAALHRRTPGRRRRPGRVRQLRDRVRRPDGRRDHLSATTPSSRPWPGSCSGTTSSPASCSSTCRRSIRCAGSWRTSGLKARSATTPTGSGSGCWTSRAR